MFVWRWKKLVSVGSSLRSIVSTKIAEGNLKLMTYQKRGETYPEAALSNVDGGG